MFSFKFAIFRFFFLFVFLFFCLSFLIVEFHLTDMTGQIFSAMGTSYESEPHRKKWKTPKIFTFQIGLPHPKGPIKQYTIYFMLFIRVWYLPPWVQFSSPFPMPANIVHLHLCLINYNNINYFQCQPIHMHNWPLQSAGCRRLFRNWQINTTILSYRVSL